MDLTSFITSAPLGASASSSPADHLIGLEAQYGALNYRPLDVVLTRGQGVWVWDVDGKRYLDCLAAYSAVNQDTRIRRL